MRTGAFAYNASFSIWQVIRFDRDTSETSTITSAQGSAMRPVLSPDGKKLVYATRYETGTAFRVRDLETSEEHWLTYPVTRDTKPGYAFMPDGKSLIVPIGPLGAVGPAVRRNDSPRGVIAAQLSSALRR